MYVVPAIDLDGTSVPHERQWEILHLCPDKKLPIDNDDVLDVEEVFLCRVLSPIVTMEKNSEKDYTPTVRNKIQLCVADVWVTTYFLDVPLPFCAYM